jgi:hypothetical protein
MIKKYLYAGVSEKLWGVNMDKYKWTFRTADNATARTNQLYRLGDRSIDILPLPRPMSKAEAAHFLLSIDLPNGDKGIRLCLALQARKFVPGNLEGA